MGHKTNIPAWRFDFLSPYPTKEPVHRLENKIMLSAAKLTETFIILLSFLSRIKRGRSEARLHDVTSADSVVELTIAFIKNLSVDMKWQFDASVNVASVLWLAACIQPIRTEIVSKISYSQYFKDGLLSKTHLGWQRLLGQQLIWWIHTQICVKVKGSYIFRS